MVLEDRVVGTLSLFDKIAPIGTHRRMFSMDDLNMLFARSSQIAVEIEGIRLAKWPRDIVFDTTQMRRYGRLTPEREIIYGRTMCKVPGCEGGIRREVIANDIT